MFGDSTENLMISQQYKMTKINPRRKSNDFKRDSKGELFAFNFSY